jgi:hypothetical protein
MNCQKFEGIVGELARGRMMEVDIRRDALAHSEECSRCALRLRNEDMLTRGLQLLAGDTESAQAPSHLEQRLLEVLRELRALRSVSLTDGRRRYWISAVAAVLLIVGSVIAIRWQIARSTDQIPQVAVEGGAQADSGKAATSGLLADEPAINVKHPANWKPKGRASTVLASARLHPVPKKTTTPVTNNTSKEIATEFMPLGYLNAANFQDGGQIVRVELPRSAMASFGLPVNMDRYNERVKADVLLGVDGVAHAIRFVQ